MVVALAFIRGRLPSLGQFDSLVGALFDDVLLAIAVAPMAIAVHRYILLGERSRLLPLKPLSRVLQFALWIVVIYATADLGDWLFETTEPTLASSPTILRVGIDLIFVAGLIALFVVTIRLSLIFPAIAIDSNAATPKSVWQITRHIFSVFSRSASSPQSH